MSLHKKLQALSSDRPSTWLQKAEERQQNRSWQRRSALIALRVLRELRHKGLTQRDLAEKMGVSAQQVNKIVKGQENLTLDTLVKLETALDILLLHNEKAQPVATFFWGSLPIAERRMAEIKYFNQGSIGLQTCITMKAFDIDMTSIFIATEDKHLHREYPIKGKDKWLDLHAQHS